MYNSKLKEMAKQQIKGKIGILFIINLIVFVISWIAATVLSLIPLVGPIVYSVLIAPAFALSITKIYLNIAKGNKPVAGDAFEGFYDFWSAFKVQFLIGLFTFLWSLLFIVPGIVKSFSYSMAMNILAENKGMSALEAIRRSKELTNGYKMDLFVLGLSFIGWILLGYITLGIGYIWIIPYISTTYINYYNANKPQAEPIIVEEPIAVEAPQEDVEESEN